MPRTDKSVKREKSYLLTIPKARPLEIPQDFFLIIPGLSALHAISSNIPGDYPPPQTHLPSVWYRKFEQNIIRKDTTKLYP